LRTQVGHLPRSEKCQQRSYLRAARTMPCTIFCLGRRWASMEAVKASSGGPIASGHAHHTFGKSLNSRPGGCQPRGHLPNEDGQASGGTLNRCVTGRTNNDASAVRSLFYRAAGGRCGRSGHLARTTGRESERVSDNACALSALTEIGSGADRRLAWSDVSMFRVRVTTPLAMATWLMRISNPIGA
jgi:hypothetical protein